MNEPESTRCPFCGTVAAEVCCHICKLPRPWVTFAWAKRQTQGGTDAPKPDTPAV